MAVANLNIPTFPSFDLDDHTTTATRWEKYKKRFLNLCVALNVQDDKQKLALLLNYVGEELYDIYDSLLVPTTDGSHETYEHAIKLLDGHLNPKSNVTYELYLFRNLKQNIDELIQAFYVRVKQQAMKCNFGANLENEIKQQLILATTSNKLRQHAFRNPELTLENFLIFAKNLEDTTRQAGEVEKQLPEEVNRMKLDKQRIRRNDRDREFGKKSFDRGKSSQQRSEKKTCYRCGGVFPHNNSCPAVGEKCDNCHKIGHFARCCRSRQAKQGKSQRSLNTLTAVTSNPNSDSDESVIFSIFNETNVYDYTVCDFNNPLLSNCVIPERSQGVHVVNSLSKFKIDLKVESLYPVKFLIDSGSALNILTLKTFEQMNKKVNGNLTLRKSSTKVLTYRQEKPNLKILGVTACMIESKQKIICAEFHVINTNHRNLLSGNLDLDLDLIYMTPDNNNRPHELNTVKDHQPNEPQEKTNQPNIPVRLKSLIKNYKTTLFNGKIGKFKNIKVKLHINPKITPVAQSERRIPFALRKQVQEEIEKLEKNDIIEDITNEPTPWLSPLVAVKKGQNNIRLCLDMRHPNQAITRTRFPTPTIDDLLVKLKGSNHFSKLDLKSAFHQLELDESCRYITAFRTENKVKRFKRVIFGANSASEELQHALHTILADIDGALNIADDILIYASNTQQHDQILNKVFARLAEKGITLNLAKCIFDKTILEFYGYVFSQNGMQPIETKIKALNDAAHLENVKAVRSFLGMTNYLKRFIPAYSSITYPLRKLTKQDSQFIWDKHCENAFQQLKSSLTSSSCISYYDEKSDLFLYCDASPVGISSILLQKTPGKHDMNVIAYCSRALNEVEQRYSQIERECLSVEYACVRNR